MNDKQNSQERLCAVISALCDRHAVGCSNLELAKLVNTSATNVCRDLSVLEKKGWAEHSSRDGRWRLSPLFGGLAGEIMKSYREAKLLLSKEEERYASAMQ